MQVLLVDDSRTVRQALRRMLSATGVEVLEAAHGGEALDFWQTWPTVSAVLIDWFMPVMDGLSLLRAIRARPHLPQPKLLMCTRQDDPVCITQALELGADEYLIKPFNAEILLSKLRLAGLTLPVDQLSL